MRSNQSVSRAETGVEVMAGTIEGKVAIVTGAATGIGRATAELFASEGASVVVADRNDVEGERTAAGINEHGGDAIFLECDVSKADNVRQMVENTVERLGPPDILVNNAGVFIRMAHRVHEITDMEWDLTMQTNLKGAFYCCKYVLPHMMEKGGSIVSISSVTALGGRGLSGPYGISKAGVIRLGKAVADEYGEYGIRSNVILPGLTDTPQARGSTGSAQRFEERTDEILLGRTGQPEDIASLVLFLASDQSSFITGASYIIDGGGVVFSQ